MKTILILIFIFIVVLPAIQLAAFYYFVPSIREDIQTMFRKVFGK